MILAACASPQKRAATDFMRQGRALDAAGVWLTAVEADVDDPVMKKHLDQAVPTAWEAELDIAHDFEAAGKPEDAAAAYRDLLAFHDRVLSVGVAVPPTDDLRAELTAAEDESAAKRYAEGVAASDASKWPDAIAAYTAARALRPEYKDTTARMAAALHAQGAADVEAKRYRDALSHYDQAYALAGDDASEAWAAAIRVAWARKDLADGRCRSAYDALTAARGHIADASLAADTETARRCARRELVVPPAEDATGTSPHGVAVGAVLADQATIALRAHGSEHLRLVDGSTPPPAAADGSRVTIKTRITDLRVESKDDVLDRHAPGRTMVICGGDEADSFQEGVGFVCERTVTVNWTEHVHTRTARIGGTARIFGGDGVEVSAVPFMGVEDRDGRWAEAFTVDGQPAHLGADPAVGTIALSGDYPTATAAPIDGDSDIDLLLGAIGKAADAIATGTILVADQPEKAADPGWLVVQPPALAPGDLQFKAPDADGKAEPI